MKVSKVIIFSSCLYMFFMAVAAENQAAAEEECYKEKARCGDNGPPIRFPFRLKHRQPPHCGYPGFDLYCTSANHTALDLPNLPMTLIVKTIDYEYQSLEVYNPDTCGLKQQNLQFSNLPISPFQFQSYGSTLFNCSSKQPSDGNYFSRVPCLGDHKYSAWVTDSSDYLSSCLDELISCRKMLDVPSVPPQIFQWNASFVLEWLVPSCSHCEAKGKRCRLKKNDTQINETECFKISKPQKGALMIAGVIVGSLVLILVAVAIFYVYTQDKSEREHRLRIRKFLKDYENFKPSRYTYADIKKITDHFKDKLGQGAYGTVFKGKLSNEIVVAVKILDDFKGDGEQFINEVATMGQIHHVNVVRLVGYCAEGFRRALIYEFLPNHSLEKYVSSAITTTNHSLSWETSQDIALGIAKGIEYLHQGCDQRILHFDIKPHNILLDQNLVPKISDFGLAKLCSKDQSAVSMTTARGTMGYIAPEVFSRNFGNVSCKSDVYSFGMLLLEMIGKRKNTNVTKENAEEIYYPEWIYNLLEEGEDLRIQIEEEADAKIAKKLAIVGLWCIQWHPVGRPAMKVVVQMLEGGVKLSMPPNPFATTGQSNTNKNMPTRRIALELEAIAE